MYQSDSWYFNDFLKKMNSGPSEFSMALGIGKNQRGDVVELLT
jgi:hypothetical protein